MPSIRIMMEAKFFVGVVVGVDGETVDVRFPVVVFNRCVAVVVKVTFKIVDELMLVFVTGGNSAFVPECIFLIVRQPLRFQHFS